MRETVTAEEAAEVVGLSPWTIYSLARRGAIPHVRIGRRVLFRRSSLLQWLEAEERASVKTPAKRAGADEEEDL